MAKIKKIAQELNWELEKKTTYGEVEGYFVTLTTMTNVMAQPAMITKLIVSFEGITPAQQEGLRQFCKSNKKELRAANFEIKNGFINIMVNEAFKQLNAARTMEVLNKLIEGFKKNNIVPGETCVFCGAKEVDTTTKIHGIKFVAHHGCVLKAKEERELQAMSYNSQSSNYVRGMVGALIGAVIGTIPWLIVSFLTNFYAAILAMIIGFSAFFFYKKFGGKVTPLTKYFIGIATVVGILFTNIFIVAFIIVNSGYPLLMQNFVVAYTDPELAPLLLGDLGLAFLMGFLGFFSVLRKVKQEEFTPGIE